MKTNDQQISTPTLAGSAREISQIQRGEDAMSREIVIRRNGVCTEISAEKERRKKAEERKRSRSMEAKTQYPEKSLMDEMNAAIASELAASQAQGAKQNGKDNGKELKVDRTMHSETQDKEK
ncbi:hypothetical protein OSTOST_06819 [Ostertagia ostertagi]